MAANNASNVWSQMNYVPPRGQCNFRQSLLSSKCPCLRFMLHPLKSSSSYECDGCSHHASFHSMENPAEDEIRKRWEQEAKEKEEHDSATQRRPKKRPRAIEYSHIAGVSGGGIFTADEMDTTSETGSTGSKSRARGRARGVASATRNTRGQGRIVEVLDDLETAIEVD